MNLIPSKVVGVQFSILSADEIQSFSVAEVSSKDTYTNNKPVPGGLFDIRMGVIDNGLICPIDGLDHMSTPGYFGHLKLARPVFYIQYLSTIIKILKSVCFKCSKLLINKTKHCALMNLRPEQRWKVVFNLATKIKRCGEETESGCGCKQPKIRKEELATIYGDWINESKETFSVNITPEMVLKIFRRISNEDIIFMGFSPVWSRPESMICQVMAIPPPSVRPSIRHDLMQRCEDDLTHILVNIIKTNNTLKEKIQNNSSVADEWAKLLQYHFASLVDNRFPGGASVAQRSGRPLKCIKDRLNGKGGRIRGNLMAKRVDFSARSVITADPNISLAELGIPLKIAKNITKPVKVNDRNKRFLTSLVRNGADVYPGAKILEVYNPICKEMKMITLKYRMDRENIVLQNGDIVHRHILDGDYVLFNRQPTLHRMSMMAHRAKVLMRGETFRLNVAVTKPYNADFDGDEMNMHMPQDVFSDAELEHLAAVPFQLVSPANNQTIIGVFQDSMLGCFQFTRKSVSFGPREAMNLLMKYDKVNEVQLYNLFQADSATTTTTTTTTAAKTTTAKVNSFEILSQILPPLSLNYKLKSIGEGDGEGGEEESFLRISNGKYLSGRIDKSVLGSKTKGVVHRICNDFGNSAASKFIDDLQNIVTEYLKLSTFSVGVSDLMEGGGRASAAGGQEKKQQIQEIISKRKEDVRGLIHQLELSVFENNTGRSNAEEFENQVNNILNRVSKETQKVGLQTLHPDNRFRTMVNAGSKGSELNISQMIACVGQQNVDGKRIPYGFDDRTLPHFTKFDDSPEARGFVLNSYMDGLTPQELFFHAMGGRVGLIDTAVKTSTTGYIQRRLIKGMEDLMVHYDMTVRSNKNQIIQFIYGEDGVDTVKVESQQVPFVKMSLSEIFAHYDVPVTEATKQLIFDPETLRRVKRQKDELHQKNQAYVDKLIQNRDAVAQNVFKMRNDSNVYCPVSFFSLIENVRGQLHLNARSIVNITPLEVYEKIEECFAKLSFYTYVKPTRLFEALFYYYLSPRVLVYDKRFHRAAIDLLMETILVQYKRSIIAPGEMVGMIAAQSIGEPTTQMTLNTFHFSGISSKSNVTRGVPRIEEILSLTTDQKNPSLTIYLKPEDETNREKARSIMSMIEHTKMADIVNSVEICYDPHQVTNIADDLFTMEQFYEFERLLEKTKGLEKPQGATTKNSKKSKWIIRMDLNAEKMMEKNITMDDVHFVVKNVYGKQVSCVYSDYNAEKLIFRVRLETTPKVAASKRIKKPKKETSATKKKAKKKEEVEEDVEEDVEGEGEGEGEEEGHVEEGNKKEEDVGLSDQTDDIYMLKMFQQQLLQNVVIKGVKNIKAVILRKLQDMLRLDGDQYKPRDIWVLDTVGTNLLDVLSQDYIDHRRTISNDITEMLNIFGIEAARQCIYNEFSEVIEFDGAYIDYKHVTLLVDRMMSTYKPISICRHGINKDNIGPIAKASFEETPEMFLSAAKHAELDIMKGVSANVLCGQEGYYGTNSFQIILDLESMMKSKREVKEKEEHHTEEVGGMDAGEEESSVKKLWVLEDQLSNVENIQTCFLGDVNDKYDLGF
jgi:DNA-directed RNA polymerase II subunit RPB1